MILLEVSCWSVSLSQSTSLLLDPASQGELDLGVVHLCHEWAAALAGLNNLTPDDLDSVSPGSVPGSHVPVALGDSGRDGQVPVLTVHVVGAGPGVVSQPDTEVLDLKWLPLPDLLDRHDLSSSLLELPELPQEIPETRLGNDLVGGENSHPVERSDWLTLSGELASDDTVFFKCSLALHFVF